MATADLGYNGYCRLRVQWLQLVWFQSVRVGKNYESSTTTQRTSKVNFIYLSLFNFQWSISLYSQSLSIHNLLYIYLFPIPMVSLFTFSYILKFQWSVSLYSNGPSLFTISFIFTYFQFVFIYATLYITISIHIVAVIVHLPFFYICYLIYVY